MASLAVKDEYLQKLARKVCATQNQEPRKRPFVPFQQRSEASQSWKKKKRNKKKQTNRNIFDVDKKPQVKTSSVLTVQTGPGSEHTTKFNIQNGAATKNLQASRNEAAGPGVFCAVDLLRKKLHEKIEESRGHGNSKGLSSEALAMKRQRRKQERDRKKRKRKEFRMKRLAEEVGEVDKKDEGQNTKNPSKVASGAGGTTQSCLVFNKVEVGDSYMSKAQVKKDKKKCVKGNLTPLTGKNYKQLLTRVEARKAKLETLKGKDEAKAKEMEEKMKWTNVLYKAEGLKIKDNEELLRASLKRKEKMRDQRKKRWNQRSENVVEKMQHRQDKRRKNIQKQKHGKIEKRKEKARKKGRVLPEDLKKAKL